MPLAERDINTQREVARPRNKRASFQRALAFRELKDENSPAPRTASKATPPSQRVLAPTKASLAKTTGQVTTGRRTPQPQLSPHSQLPLRAPTTDLTLTLGKSSSHMASRGVLAQAAAHPGSHLALKSPDPEHTLITGQAKSNPCHSLSADKPLPPQPVASLITTLDPTRHSRGLIDASELPLTMSMGSNALDWPTLTPKAINNTPLLRTHPDVCGEVDNTVLPGLSHHASSMLAAASELTHVITGKPSASTMDSGEIADIVQSSTSSFVSANDVSPQHMSEEASLEPKGVLSASEAKAKTRSTEDDIRPQQDPYPSRRPSLRNGISSGHITHPALDAVRKVTAFTDLPSKDGTARADSRPHSPSAASFSRPRPSSLSHGRRLPSPSPSTHVNTSEASIRNRRTASRIPLRDSKKATLVDVKTSRGSGSQAPKSGSGASFGSRRLDAPDALRILDHGIKRRQLQTTNIRASSTASPPIADKVSNPSDSPSIDVRRSSSLEHTCGPTSSEDDEAKTPADHDFTPYTNSYYHKHALKLFDNAVTAPGKTPPSTSPYTVPLQTIPSQAVLPSFAVDGHFEMHSPGTAERAKDLETDLQPSAGPHVTLSESTRSSLLDLLSAYDREDSHLSSQSMRSLSQEASAHLTKTLSSLEGNRHQASANFDDEALLEMFGHLKRGIQTPDKVSLVNNAAAAEKYLAETNKTESGLVVVPPNGEDAPQSSSHANNKDSTSDAYDTCQLGSVRSKWSNSTSSDKIKTCADEIAIHQTNHSDTGVSRKVSSKSQPGALSPPSIGYPSRIPSKAAALIGPAASGACVTPNVLKRLSSPMIPTPTQGSVRHARETLRSTRGGFQRTTASTGSKNTAKFSTPGAQAIYPSRGSPRGRVSSGGKGRSNIDSVAISKTPRSQSRSRLVLDKLNGLFSGKRDKKSLIAIPTIPSRYLDNATKTRHVKVAGSGSPVLKPAGRSPPGAKMPTTLHVDHFVARSASTATTETPSDLTAVESGAEANDTQGLQDWCEALIGKARCETQPARKERLLSFAKVLNDSLISAREAQISAETAAYAARNAQVSYEMTKKSIAMLQRLAGSLGHAAIRR